MQTIRNQKKVIKIQQFEEQTLVTTNDLSWEEFPLKK